MALFLIDFYLSFMRHSFYSLVNVIKEEEEKEWMGCGFNINANYGV